MCRLLGFAGSNEEEFRRLFSCLRGVAENDPLNRKEPSHKDGWGYVAVSSERLQLYKTAKPIFKDDEVPKVRGYSLVVVHARQTSFEALVSARHSHPYHYTTVKGDFFFAHNGSVDREALAKVLRVRDPEAYVDSELAGLLIAQKGLRKGYEILAKHMRSSLDSLVVHLSPKKVATLYYYGAFDVERVKSKGLPEDYYQLYYVKGRGFEAVLSSSLLFHPECRGMKAEKIDNGVLKQLGRRVALSSEQV